ncbi:MAG: NAD-dependent epimerase/dehydratase family protein [Suipraeoptans sp.]
MKILYIGASDDLASSFIERMVKEEYELYLFSNLEVDGYKGKYKYYEMTDNATTVTKLLQSISPEVIVFAGNHFAEDGMYLELGKYYNLLLQVLRETKSLKQLKEFVLLSSTEVYDVKADVAYEDVEISPKCNKGIFFASLENSFVLYENEVDYPRSILRLSDMYSDNCSNNKYGIVNRAYRDIEMSNSEVLIENKHMQLLHVDDAIDALFRVIESQKCGCYNVASLQIVESKTLYENIAHKLNKSCDVSVDAAIPCPYINCDKIVNELEWVDRADILTDVSKGRIIFDKKKEVKVKRKWNMPKNVRELVENTLLFLVFFFIYTFTYDHGLFSSINWLLIYVILAAINMGVRQSIIAIVLSSASYLLVNRTSILQMTNFYSYSESILIIMQFIFLGMSISYSCELLKKKIEEQSNSLSQLTKEYREVEDINRQNVRIKKEYEKRLLESETGLPRLQTITKRLNKLSVDEVYAEVLHVFSEFLDTYNLAIYYMKDDTPRLRLMNSLGDSYFSVGKTWDLSNNSNMLNTLRKGEIYIGSVWKNEPAAVLPIVLENKTIAVIMLKVFSTKRNNLYNLNTIRTLGTIISDSIAMAIKYEEACRNTKYLTGTKILKKKAFSDKLALAKQREQRNLANYKIIEAVDISIPDMDRVRKEGLRETDYCGVLKNNKIGILLNNTTEVEVDYVIARLLDIGVKAEKYQY